MHAVLSFLISRKHLWDELTQINPPDEGENKDEEEIESPGFL
jgi:hypothetical protein